MRINKLFVLVVFICTLNIYAQENQDSSSTSLTKIKEVYGDYYEKIVLNDPARTQILTNLLENRIEFLQTPITPDEKYEKLSKFSLFNKYNSTLERDSEFIPETFNVLKYNLSFYLKYDKIIRFDNSDWLIIIRSNK